MLVLKKISTKKLAVYLSIIALMLISAGFILFKNRGSNDSASPAINDSAPGEARVEEFMPQAGKIENSRDIDLKIFSSEKYKELKENVLIPRGSLDLGKRDPFKPN